MTLIFIFPKIQSYISNKLASPACYNNAQTRTHKAWFATLKRAEYSSDFSFQNFKIFEGKQLLLKFLPSIFLAVPLVLDLCYWLFLACSSGYSKLGARG